MRAVTAWLRTLFAASLIVGVYGLVCVAVVGELVLVFGSLSIPTADRARSMDTAVLMSSFTLPVVFTLVLGVLALSRATAACEDSVQLPYEQAPELWDMVNSLATRIGTRPPAELHLVATANAFVSEETQMLGLVVGMRRMYIGVPLLLGLNRSELRAVLCHELGHYAGRHTRMSDLTYRGGVALELIFERLRLTAVAGRNGYATLLLLFISRYAKLYQRVSFAVRRRQEIEADATAAAIAGKQVTASALRRVHELRAAWDHFVAGYLAPVQQKGFVPADLFLVFDDLLRDPRYRDQLAAVQNPAPARKAARRDTHPPLAERLRMLDSLEDHRVPAGEHDLAPAIDLLTDQGALLPSVQETLFRSAQHQPEPLPWQEWANLAAAVTATMPALALLNVASRLSGVAQPTPNTVLELLERGSGDLIATALAEGTRPVQEPRQLLRTALFALVGQALVAGGHANWELSWTGTGVLVADESRLLRVHDLVDTAVSGPVHLHPLHVELTLLGIHPDAPVAMPGKPHRATDDTSPRKARLNTTITPAKRDEQQAREVKAALSAAVVWYAAIVFWAWVVTPYTPSQDPLLAGHIPQVISGVPLPTVSPPPIVWPTFPPPTFPTPTLPSVPLYLTVTVGPGDTLSSIACRNGTTVHSLQALNMLGTSTTIQAGQQLLVLEGTPTRDSCT